MDLRQMRAMRHAAGGRYFDFTPVVIVALASSVGARDLTIGAGDTERYLFAGMRAAMVLSFRGFLFLGRARRMGAEPPIRHTVHHRQPSWNGAAIMPEEATATLEIPQGVLDAAQMNAHELRRELALALYAQRRLSLGKARELAGLSLWEFRQWLGLRRIEAHYDAADVQDDLATLRELGRLP